jgi:Mrp family chromosome partitioning ATPase/capsular polysaccharide biosynthesis protein
MAEHATPVPGAIANTPEPALGPYFRAVRRNWLLVAAVTLLTGAVAAATVLHKGLNYQASATVLVSPLEQGDANFLDTGVVIETGEPVRTVQTAAALINSQPAAQDAAVIMGAGWSVTRVQNAISVTPLGQSDVLNVTAQAGSSTQATQLANAFAKAAVGYRARIVQHNISVQLGELTARLNQASGTGIADVSLAQELATRIAALRAAQVSGGDPSLSVTGLARTGSSTGASHSLIVLLSLIGGFAIGSVAALAVDFFNRRIRDIDELELLSSAPVLTVVPQVGGARNRGVLRPGAFPPTAFEQVRMLRVQLASREGAPVIMLTSPGAGDGKTTLAAALAAAFAETGEQVILIDLDLRKPDVAKLLGLKQPRATRLLDASLEELLVEVPDLPNVRVLPAPRGDLAVFSMLLARLPKLLDEAEAKGGHVIIDTAPVGVVSETLEVAKICDQVVLTVRPGHTDRRRLVIANDLLVRAGAPVVGVVAVAQSTARTDDAYGYAYGTALGATSTGEAAHTTAAADDAQPPRTRVKSA